MLDKERLQNVYRGFDVAVGAVVRAARRRGDTIPCKAGCAHCCYDVAMISTAEARGLVEAIRGLPEDVQQDVRGRTKAWLAVTTAAGVNVDHPDLVPYLKLHVACPLLDLQTTECRVYEMRPLACRGHYPIAPSADGCAKRAEKPGIQCLLFDDFLAMAFGEIYPTTTTQRVPLRVLGQRLAEALRLVPKAEA